MADVRSGAGEYSSALELNPTGLLDTASDAVAAASVAVTGAIILATRGNYWLDPTVALLVSVVIGYHAIHLLRRVVVALRYGTPASSPKVGRQ